MRVCTSFNSNYLAPASAPLRSPLRPSFLSSFARGGFYPRRFRTDVIVRREPTLARAKTIRKGSGPAEREHQATRGVFSARGHFDSSRPDVRVARPREARNREIEAGSTTYSRDDTIGYRDTAEPRRRLTATWLLLRERASERASERRERKLTLRSPPLPPLPPTSMKPRTRSPAFLPDCFTPPGPSVPCCAC